MVHTDAEFPPLGNPALLQGICDDSVGAINRLHETYGRMVVFPSGPDRTVFAFGPEANHAVFGDTSLYHMIGPVGPKGSAQRSFQLGLLGLNGKQHLEHRRMLHPALRKDASLAMVEPIQRLVQKFLDGWQVGTKIDLYASMKELSLSFAAQLLFGLPGISRGVELTSTFQQWLDAYIACLFEMTLPVAAPPGSYERMLDTAETLAGHFRELIADRRGILRDEDADLLAIMLRARDAGRIGDPELIGEMHTLLNASYQTTATALTWTLFLLHQHPEVLGRLHSSFQGGGTSEPALLEGVIKESMRLMPPVIFTHRRASRPAELLGVPFPQGTTVFVGFYVTHHLAETFVEPEVFNPDRWAGLSVSPYAYLPFAAGARMCMGAVIAMELFKVAIPAVVRRYRLEIPVGARIDRHASLTLGVENLPATIRAQDGRFMSVPVFGNVHEMVRLPGMPPARVAA